MLAKEAFTQYIDKLKEFAEIENAINEAGKKFEFFSFSFPEYAQLVIDILTDAFEDECGWISYFIYDLELGSKWKESSISINGRSVRITNASELYDILIENMKRSN